MKNLMRMAALAACLVASAPKASADEATLVLDLEDGTSLSCSFAKKPQMTFADGTLTLTSSEGAVGSWEFAAVDSWHFAAADPSGIRQTAAGRTLAIRDGRVYIYGEQQARLYDLSGKAVEAGVRQEGEARVLATEHLPAGVYVLTVGKQGMKFTVK